MNTKSDKSASIYDRLQGLYQLDPEEFDRLREALIQEELDNAPDDLKAKAYGIQRRLEHQLRKYKDPTARMNAMVEIFWQQFHEFQAVLNDPVEVIENKRRCGTSAKVIPFKDRNQGH